MNWVRCARSVSSFALLVSNTVDAFVICDMVHFNLGRVSLARLIGLRSGFLLSMTIRCTSVDFLQMEG